MTKFLSFAAALICFGMAAQDVKAGVGSFMSFNAAQTSFAFDVNGNSNLTAFVTATINTGGVPLVFSATEPTNFLTMNVVGATNVVAGQFCSAANGFPLGAAVNGTFACSFPTTVMTFDGNVIGSPITITGHICPTSEPCTGPTANSTFVATPEPTALALVAIGLLGLGLARRRAMA